MQFIENSEKSVDELVKTIEERISDFKFGILHIHNIKQTLISKGIEFKKECRVLDVCNPIFANELLSENMSISSIMPCKISIYEDGGKSFICMNSIVPIIEEIEPKLKSKAIEIQNILLDLINNIK